MLDVYTGSQHHPIDVEIKHQPNLIETTGIPQDLLVAFQQHVNAHQQVHLAVDHEGVILPHVYGQLESRFHHYSPRDLDGQAEIIRAVDRLSTNAPVKDLIRTFSRQDSRVHQPGSM